MNTYPFYIIDDILIESDDKTDIPHSELWRLKVAIYVANKYGISYNSIKDLCYSFMRGRVSTPTNQRVYSTRQLAILNKKGIDPIIRVVYFGEKDLYATKIIRKHYPKYEIKYDSHHKRQDDDVARFNRLLPSQQ